MALRSATLNVMTKAARTAAVRLKRDYGEVEQLQVSRKGPADFVTAADERTEKILRNELERARPDYGFLMEEGGTVKGKDPTKRWIIDPIDGTTNFIHGIAHFAMSVALEDNGEIVAGLIFDPINEQMFTAEKGQGAYLNERRLRVSKRERMDMSLFATGIPFLGRHSRADDLRVLAEIDAVMSVSAGIRRFGSAALDLAYVAAGRFDGYWETGLKPWDIAAGILLVREAGGIITEIDGGDKMMDSGSVVAANSAMHGPLRQILRGAKA